MTGSALELRLAEQPPFAIDVAYVVLHLGGAALRFVAHADFLARVAPRLELLEHRQVSAMAGLRVLPGERLVVGALVERLARDLEKHADIDVVEELGGPALQHVDELRACARCGKDTDEGK